MALSDDIALLSKVPLFAGLADDKLRLMAFGAERRRLVEAAKAQARVRPGAPPVGRQPPPHRRHGLRTLGQLGGLYIEGGAQRPTQAPRPAPMPAKVRPSAPSELAQREARLRAQMEAKRAKRQENGKGRGR